MTATKERIDDLIACLKADQASGGSNSVSRIATSMVQLSYFAYNEPIDTIPKDVADPSKVFPPLNDCRWQCVWGPAIDPDDGNLLYVAGLYAGSADEPIQSPPFAVAVVIRGTADPSVSGFLSDLYEDATPVPQDQWMNDPNAWIANGSDSALSTVTSLTSGGQTLLEFLSALPEQDGHAPTILVTGHSLGGCIATVLAPWLVANLPPAKAAWLTPMTFAGPTAGNQGFVNDLVDACPLRQIYVNPMDVVPMAWGDVSSIPDIYGLWYFDPAVAAWAVTTIAALDVLDYPYAPVPSKIPPLPGAFITIQDPIFGVEWFQEALAQHSCANYMLLMGLVPAYGFSSGATRMQRLDGSQRATLRPRQSEERRPTISASQSDEVAP